MNHPLYEATRVHFHREPGAVTERTVAICGVRAGDDPRRMTRVPEMVRCEQCVTLMTAVERLDWIRAQLRSGSAR